MHGRLDSKNPGLVWILVLRPSVLQTIRPVKELSPAIETPSLDAKVISPPMWAPRPIERNGASRALDKRLDSRPNPSTTLNR
eukprot:37746-Amphidinium_carterae.1